MEMNISVHPSNPAIVAKGVLNFVAERLPKIGMDDDEHQIYIWGPAARYEDGRWMLWTPEDVQEASQLGVILQEYFVIGTWSSGGSMNFTEYLLVGHADLKVYATDGVLPEACRELDGSPAH